MPLQNLGVGLGEGSDFCGGGRGEFFLKRFKTNLQCFGVLLVQINI